MHKISALRQWMHNNNLSAFITPSSDAHQSVHLAPHWACIKWLTAFTGSAGTAVVTTDNAAMWTDARYFLQAEIQLRGFELQRDGLPDTPTIGQWITDNTPIGSRIGINGQLFTKSQADSLQAELPERHLVFTTDPYDQIWSDRPTPPYASAFVLDTQYSGETTLSKIERIRREDATILVSTLDEIAWLLNIRGGDIECNPVVISHLAIEPTQTLLFVDSSKFSTHDKKLLHNYGILLREYDQWNGYLESISGKVITNTSRLSCDSFSRLKQVHEVDFAEINMAKAAKNNTELDGFRRAMVDDGVALCRFMMWLESSTGATEYEAAERLSSERARTTGYRGESFGAIVAYGVNGAQAHYSPQKESSSVIGRDNFLLIDSGGQYLYGTTDITRTYHFGEPTVQQKRDYTNVLMGMIDLSRAHFPVGSRGAQLDILARQHLWQDGANYLHGTGHGVGHFLCAHEGPQSIRMNENPVKLIPGMVQSVEPAIYRNSEYGIRTENLVAVTMSNHDGFLCFETLTLSPIDTIAIEPKMMQHHHISWLNDYHKTVYEKLSPHLESDERAWLARKTQPI